MSIVKDVNVNGRTFTDSSSLWVYLIDDLKTDDGQNVAGLGFITDNYLDEFQTVKIANQKTAGRQFRQITIAPSPAGKGLAPEEYLKMGTKIAEFYYDQGFQVIIVFHNDTDTPHLHLMINSVNFRTGKMFSQSISGLNRFKLRCNNEFAEYGLDPIGKPTEMMMDTVVHEMSEGFDCLELFDEVMADKASALADLCNDPSDSMPIAINLENWHNSEYTPNYYYFSANDSTRNSYLQKSYKNNQEEKYMNNIKNNQELPAVSVEQLPSLDSATPGLYVDFGKEVNMTIPKSWSHQDVSEFVNSIDTLPPSEKAYNAKIGEALFTDMKSRGIEAPVGISSIVKLNLSFDDVMESNIIDIPYSEE